MENEYKSTSCTNTDNKMLNINEKNIIIPKFHFIGIACAVLSKIPSLLYIFLPVEDTLVKFHRRIDNNIKIGQNTRLLTRVLPYSNNIISEVILLVTTPNKNTKVQNLSLLSHFSFLAEIGCLLVFGMLFLVKSCINYLIYFRVIIYSYIISYLRAVCKQIQVFLAIFLMLFLAPNAIASNKISSDKDKIIAVIKATEKQYNIPSGLLLAISKIESRVIPYAVNIGGKAYYPASLMEARNIALHHLNQGLTNIDLGVMQINYRWHGKKFNNIDEMLSVNKNIGYAAKLLCDLKKQHGSWHKAVRYYHSRNKVHNMQYSKKVIICWLLEK